MTEHFLITVVDLRSNFHVHAYLMCNDRKLIEGVLNQMADEVEKMNEYAVPFAMQTKLSPSDPNVPGVAGMDGIDIVRKIVCENLPEARQVLDEAKDFHVSIWGWDVSHPDNAALMALH